MVITNYKVIKRSTRIHRIFSIDSAFLFKYKLCILFKTSETFNIQWLLNIFYTTITRITEAFFYPQLLQCFRAPLHRAFLLAAVCFLASDDILTDGILTMHVLPFFIRPFGGSRVFMLQCINRWTEIARREMACDVNYSIG